MALDDLRGGFKLVLIILIVAIAFGTFVLVKGLLQKGSNPTQTVSLQNVDFPTTAPKEIGEISVLVNTYPGFAPMYLFNGGEEPSEESIFYKKYGLKVRLIRNDNFVTGRDALKSDEADILWVTLDSYGADFGLAPLDPVFFMGYNFSHGADVVLGAKSIKTIKDLRGKRVACALGQPSNTLLRAALDANGMKMSDIELIPVADAIGAADMLRSGNSDGAVVWAPDDKDLIANVEANVLVSSADAAGLITDGLMAKKEVMLLKEKLFTSFAEGVYTANALLINSQEARETASRIMSSYFNKSSEDVLDGIMNVKFITYGDAAGLFGLRPTTKMGYREIYEKNTSALVREGFLKTSEVMNWTRHSSTKIIKNLSYMSGMPNQGPEGPKDYQKIYPEDTHTMVSISNKPIQINFATGSYALDFNEKSKLRAEFGDIVREYPDIRIRLSGHTDNIGNPESNQILSQRRANSVGKFLAEEYNFDPDRVTSVGYGQGQPLVPNTSEENRSLNRRVELEFIK